MTTKTYLQERYRPDVDGLRGLAILSVVIFHIFPSALRGGFIGVDIFFVISGFLISSIILRNIDNDSFSFLEFYARRIRRIFPALILVLFVCLSLGYVCLFADEYKQLSRHVVRAAEFSINFTFAKKTGYFENAAAVKPLLHLWSLAVEEQFYIVWPAVVWFCWRRNVSLLVVIVGLLLASFATNVIEVGGGKASYFYLPQSRSWELLLGALLAYLKLNQPGRPWVNLQPRLTQLLHWVGPLLILLGLLTIDETRLYPYWWALLPTLGGLLVLSAPQGFWFNRSFLSSGPMVWFGLISYPLYLWHWPILSFVRITCGDSPSLGLRAIILLASVLAAWLTYRLVEHPLRIRRGRVVVLGLAVAMVAVAVLAHRVERDEGLHLYNKGVERVSKAIVRVETASSNRLPYHPYQDRKFYYMNSNNRETTLFLGSSNVDQYYPRVKHLVELYPDRANSFIFSSGGGCLPMPNIKFDRDHQHCNDLASKTLSFVEHNKQVGTVVIGAAWNSHLVGGSALDGSYGYGTQDYAHALGELSGYIKAIRALNRRVILVLNIPTSGKLDPKTRFTRNVSRFPDIFVPANNEGAPLSEVLGTYGQLRDDLAEVAERSGAVFIDPLTYLCDGSLCPNQNREGVEIYKDAGHLSADFVRDYASFIDTTVMGSSNAVAR